MNNLSIHCYAWLPTWTTELGRTALDKARAAGFGRLVIPTRDHSAIDPPAIARLLEAHGMKASTSATQLPDADISSTDRAVRKRGLERHRRSLALTRDMGADHMGGVIYGVLRKAAEPATCDNIEAAAESLAILAPEAKAAGVRLALEVVNRYESNLINTAAQALEVIRLAGSDNVYVHLDTFHMNLEEDDMLAAIDAALPRLLYFELDQNHRGRPDRGTLDFKPMLEKLKAANYQGIIGIEAFSNRVTGPDIAAACAIWRDLFADGDEIARAGMKIIREGLGLAA